MMNGATSKASRFLVVLITSAPLAVALGIRAFTVSALPNSASAGVDVAGSGSDLQAPVLPAFTDADGEALARAQACASESFTSPFIDASALPEHVDPPPITQPTLIDDTPPELVVSTLLEGRRDTIAIINGEALRLGQTVAPGWVLVAINARDQFIEIENDAGKRVTVPLTRR